MSNNSKTKVSTVIPLIIEQYKAARLEEMITRNVFRIIWFGLIIFSSRLPRDSADYNVQRLFGNSFVVIEPLGILLIAIILLMISLQIFRKFQAETLALRELIISFDLTHQDLYVQNNYRKMYKSSLFSTRLRLIQEDLIWFYGVTIILSLTFIPQFISEK